MDAQAVSDSRADEAYRRGVEDGRVSSRGSAASVRSRFTSSDPPSAPVLTVLIIHEGWPPADHIASRDAMLTTHDCTSQSKLQFDNAKSGGLDGSASSSDWPRRFGKLDLFRFELLERTTSTVRPRRFGHVYVSATARASKQAQARARASTHASAQARKHARARLNVVTIISSTVIIVTIISMTNITVTITKIAIKIVIIIIIIIISTSIIVILIKVILRRSGRMPTSVSRGTHHRSSFAPLAPCAAKP